ncbi:hypothetical protein ACFLT2_04390 [Acidobacteriota bacterium]
MKRTYICFSFLLLIISQCAVVSAQFSLEQVAERANWEEFLKTAEIFKSKKIGDGVTEPFRLYLKKNDVESSGCWKNVKGMLRDFLEGWQYEIAAYEIDKLLGLNMVPPTVERKFKGLTGSCQLWINHEHSLESLIKKKVKMPAQALANLTRMKYVARFFDSLIANEDRHQRNVIFNDKWKMILIDHSRAFRCRMKFATRLCFGKKGLFGNKPFRQLPRTLVENLKALTKEKVELAVGSYLTKMELEGIMHRKELILEEIDEMIAEKGEDLVLY